MGKKKVDGSLGRALFKSRFNKSNNSFGGAERWLHTSELEDGTDWNKLNLKSVTEQNSLDEFLTTAELAGTEFESERLNVRIVKNNVTGLPTKEQLKVITEVQSKNKDLLKIPRRPQWKGSELDAQTLQLKEREAFLDWRRHLAKAQENDHLSMTPFEKNLEFWRQLWRVIEKSDVVVQIVDARNPLIFRCEDLERYVKEVDQNKINLLLINKSDFLTERQRLAWLKHFESLNVKVVFWSAAIAAEEILPNIDELEEELKRTRTDSYQSQSTDNGSLEHRQNGENSDLDDIEEDEEDEGENKIVNKFNILADEKNDDEDENDEEEDKQKEEEETSSSTESEEELEQKKETVQEETPKSDSNLEKVAEKIETKPDEKVVTDINDNITKKLNDLNISDEEREKCRILSKEELIDLFKNIHKHVVDKAKPGFTTIGLVGYPNVGKSSTLNALLQTKKVAVSETPGKTKHYQTFILDDDLILCDCPGLVFPSFVSTRGELIINGILPIDQMRDYNEPINLVAHHIPKSVMEMIYGIELRKPKEGEDSNRLPTAEELCSAYSIFRGYMNHKGMPDVNRGSRYILKDYVNGKLLYCYPPPNVDAVSFQEHRYEISKEIKYMEKAKKLQQRLSGKKPELTSFDREFFENLQPKALTKGGIVGYHRKNKIVQHGSNIVVNKNINNSDNVSSKKHFNGKRDKLRRINKHFDQTDYY